MENLNLMQERKPLKKINRWSRLMHFRLVDARQVHDFTLWLKFNDGLKVKSISETNWTVPFLNH